jgi:cytochrome c oxidase assembly factor CtaG
LLYTSMHLVTCLPSLYGILTRSNFSTPFSHLLIVAFQLWWVLVTICYLNNQKDYTKKVVFGPYFLTIHQLSICAIFLFCCSYSIFGGFPTSYQSAITNMYGVSLLALGFMRSKFHIN